jgi:hypothetical protein
VLLKFLEEKERLQLQANLEMENTLMPANFDEMKIKLEEKNLRSLKKFLEPGSIVISYITSMFITKL